MRPACWPLPAYEHRPGGGHRRPNRLAREAERATGFLKSRLWDISDAVNQGRSLSDALAPTGDFFPRIFREMAAVGEQTGHLDAVFAQLADHYQTQLTMRRSFLGVIAWPLIELVMSLGVIGLADLAAEHAWARNVDLLGFGLTGNSGLTIYVYVLWR